MMKPFLTFLLFFFTLCSGYAQISNIQEVFALPTTLSESSGVILFNGKLISHNDSGGQNALYELDLNTGLVSRTIIITNATNVDWEDIAQDDTYIYIGDFGNNNGTRTDLKIYKTLKSDFSNSNSVTADIINFSYADQSDFTSNPQNTEWDAEALLSLNSNELVIINKNWVNGISKAYSVSKTPGTYSLSPQTTTLNSEGLITGATFNSLSGKVYLSGYTKPELPNPLLPFIWVCESFTGSDIFSGTNTKISLAANFGFEQTEAITFLDESNYYATSEAFSVSILSDYAKLISFSTSDVTLSNVEHKTQESNLIIFPNPVVDKLNIEGKGISSIEILNMQSVLLYSGEYKQVDVSALNSGIYLIKVSYRDGSFLVRRFVKR